MLTPGNFWSVRQCKFPFKYEGKVYNKCINVREVEGPRVGWNGSPPQKSTAEPAPYTDTNYVCYTVYSTDSKENRFKKWGYCNCNWWTNAPTKAPTTSAPTDPTNSPTTSPTTGAPTFPTLEPTKRPTLQPTPAPSAAPTRKRVRRRGIYEKGRENIDCRYSAELEAPRAMNTIEECQARCDWYGDTSDNGMKLCNRILYGQTSENVNTCVVLKSTGCKQLKGGPYTMYTRVGPVTQTPTEFPTLPIAEFKLARENAECTNSFSRKSSDKYLLFRGRYTHTLSSLEECEELCSQVPDENCQRFLFVPGHCMLIDDYKCPTFVEGGEVFEYGLYERTTTRPQLSRRRQKLPRDPGMTTVTTATAKAKQAWSLALFPAASSQVLFSSL